LFFAIFFITFSLLLSQIIYTTSLTLTFMVEVVSNNIDLIRLDGSYLEGGGQIVRTALALSMLTQQPFSIDKIRVGRPTPGLKAQHLNCIQALLQLTNGKANAVGAELGSTKLDFFPAKIVKSKLEIDIGTAGSTTLLLQSLLPVLVLGKKNITLTITGGTDTKWSPTFDYLKEVILPPLSAFAKIELNLLKRGFYPKGQGKVYCKVSPYKVEHLPELNITERGDLTFVTGKSFASKDLMNAQVAERQARSAEIILKELLKIPHISINYEYNDSVSTGSGITLWALFSACVKNNEDSAFSLKIGSDALGEPGKKAEYVG